MRAIFSQFNINLIAPQGRPDTFRTQIFVELVSNRKQQKWKTYSRFFIDFCEAKKIEYKIMNQF